MFSYVGAGPVGEAMPSTPIIKETIIKPPFPSIIPPIIIIKRITFFTVLLVPGYYFF